MRTPFLCHQVTRRDGATAITPGAGRLLPRCLEERSGGDGVELSALALTHIKQSRRAEVLLDLATGEARELKPVGGAGTGRPHDPNMVLLTQVPARINDTFAGEDFTRAEQQPWVEGLATVLSDYPTIRTQAAANSEKRFTESPDLADAVDAAVAGNAGSHALMADLFFADRGGCGSRSPGSSDASCTPC